MVAVVALGGAWFGRAAWRAHRNLVTLHVRNVPLAQVIRKIERQTWERIALDKRLDSLITMNVKNKPLSVVLDRIAQQCGGRWTTVYAVYDSKRALPKLEAALFGNQKLEEAGWKLIAPVGLEGEGSPMGGIIAGGSPVIMSNSAVANTSGGAGVFLKNGKVPDKDLPPGAVVTTEDAVVRSNGAREGRPPGATQFSGKGGAPVMITMRRRGDGSGGVEQEAWSPEELVIEERLNPRLGDGFSVSPTIEGASYTAKQVKGSWKTYYALKKSLVPMNLPMMGGSGGRPFGGIEITKGRGTNDSKMARHGAPSSEELAQALQQQRLEDLARLTPEQRVLRSRERPQQNSAIFEKQ